MLCKFLLRKNKTCIIFKLSLHMIFELLHIESQTANRNKLNMSVAIKLGLHLKKCRHAKFSHWKFAHRNYFGTQLFTRLDQLW